MKNMGFKTGLKKFGKSFAIAFVALLFGGIDIFLIVFFLIFYMELTYK